MKKEAILHIPLSQYAYATGEKDITIRLRAAKGDLCSCQLYYGDRVDQNPVIRMTNIKMTLVSSDDLFDYYETRLNNIYPRLCYYFVLEDGCQRQYYYERGFCTQIGYNRTEYFQFPYIRREDIISPRACLLPIYNASFGCAPQSPDLPAGFRSRSFCPLPASFSS